MNTELKSKKPDPILRRLFADESIEIDACDGSRSIAQEEKLFTSLLDPNFKRLGLDKPGVATPAMEVCIYEIARDATFAEIFGSFELDPSKLSFEQDQIISFCEKHSDRLLQNGYATIFLFNGNYQIYVACVGVHKDVDMYPDGLVAMVNRPNCDRVWPDNGAYRVVVPKLTV